MQSKNIALLQEMADDTWEVEALFDLCFAPGRMALSSYRLRDDIDPVPELCLVARDEDGILAGAIRHWPVQISGYLAVLLGPVAIHPTRQGEGLASFLIFRAIEIATQLGWDRMMLVGDASYYGRYGFTKLENDIMPPPTNPARVLGLALTADAWGNVSGQVGRLQL